MMLITRVMTLLLLASLPACGGASVSFDKEKWASGKGNFEGESPRGWMISDARKAGVKVGATRASIRALLGDPDNTGPLGDSWALGRAGYAPDYEILKVKYDENEIAIRVYILSN